MIFLELSKFFLDTKTGGDRERTDVILDARFFWRDKIAETQIRITRGLAILLPQVVPRHHRLVAFFVTVNLDVLAFVHAVRGKQAQHAMRLQPFAVDDFFQHRFGIDKNFFCFCADNFVIQNFRV